MNGLGLISGRFCFLSSDQSKFSLQWGPVGVLFYYLVSDLVFFMRGPALALPLGALVTPPSPPVNLKKGLRLVPVFAALAVFI